MIELFTIDTLHFRLDNLIWLVLAVAFIVVQRKFTNTKLDGLLRKRGWRFGNEKKLNRLLHQIGFFVGLLLCWSAVTYNSPELTIGEIMDIILLQPESLNGGSSIGSDGEPVVVVKRYLFTITIGSLVLLIALIFLVRIVLNITRILIHKVAKDKEWIDDSRKYTITQVTKYLLYVIIGVVFISSTGADITTMLFASSALFIGLGLGLRDMFTDVVSGFILLFDGSVKVGDIIEIGSFKGKNNLNDQALVAKVKSISIRTSHVKTMDGKTVIVPNSKLTEENVINWSVSDKVTRFHIKVKVAYGSDTMKVKDLLYSCALAHPLVDKKRNIVIMFEDFGDNGLHFELYFWAARTWEIMVIKSDLRFSIDKAFRENGIKVPFPQRDLHIVSGNTDALGASE